MRNLMSRFSVVLIATLVLGVGGCADMAGQLDQFGKKLSTIGRAKPSKPIATSLEQMPDDAAAVTAAVFELLLFISLFINIHNSR